MSAAPSRDEQDALLPPSPQEQVAATPPTMWRRAPGWVFYASTIPGGLLLLVADSYPTGSIGWALLGLLWLVACAGVWLVRLVAYLVGLTSENRSGRFWPFLLAPAGGVLVLALLTSGMALDVRWSASRGSFDEQADALLARVEAGRAEPYTNLVRDDRVGLYTVAFAHVDEDRNAYFVIEGSGFIDQGGFGRFPDGPPPTMAADEIDHLEGDWYTFVEPFD